ncbi:MAG: ADOP family duplicated permease [Gemmatimonadetes bacterium]|nr:ADOP family duplicated permease [Gemmatimonadota bacterium]
MTADGPGRIHRILRLGDPAGDVDEELAFHRERVIAELVAAGRSPAEAEQEARTRFGDERRYRRALTRIDRGMRARRRWANRLDATEKTMKHVMRGIVRSPGLSTGVIVAFALGIGANATMFGVVDRLLLSPPAHIARPDAVKRIVIDRYVSFLDDRVQSTSIAWADYRDFESVPQFAAVGAYQPQTLRIGRGEDARRAAAMMVTASYWDVVETRAEVGRLFTESEDRIGAQPVAVIGHALWQSLYAGDPAVLGRTLDFGHGAYTIIGVTPVGFTGTGLSRVDVWLPLQTAAPTLMGSRWLSDNRGSYWLRGVARLTEGASLAAAEEAATAVHRIGRQEHIERGTYDENVRVIAADLIEARAQQRAAGAVSGAMALLRGSQREAAVALWLSGVSAIVLLITCVNVANLLLARAIRQRREMGIRVALGVSRGRLIAHSAAEGLMLAAMGGVAALLVTRWRGELVRTVLLPQVEWIDRGLGMRTIPFVLGLSILAGLITALLPAIETTRRDVIETLRTGGGGITRSTQRVRSALTIAQATLSLVLLVGAGLFVQSLRNLRSLDLGFDVRNLYVALPVEDAGGLSDEQKRRFFSTAAEQLATHPAVRGVSWSQAVPFYQSWSIARQIPGRDSLPVPTSGGPYVNAITPAYFETMGLRVLRGRGLDEPDMGSPFVMIVNQALASLYWPDGDELGACVQLGDAEAPPCTTVVGVVEDARRGSLLEEPNPQFYVPVTHEAVESPGEALFIRLAGDGAAVLPALRRTLLAIEPQLRFVDLRPLAELTDSETRGWTLGASMFSVFGGLALIVAALGLYSVLAFDVAQRTREIGLRSALGADARRLLGIVIGHALRITGIGVAAGLVLALAVAPRIESLLYETSPRDPLILSLVSLVLLATAILASGIPAWRAVRVDPNLALRAE